MYSLECGRDTTYQDEIDLLKYELQKAKRSHIKQHKKMRLLVFITRLLILQNGKYNYINIINSCISGLLWHPLLFVLPALLDFRLEALRGPQLRGSPPDC